MYAWQFSKALYLADAHGWTRFVTMQDHYNLLNREEEREMLPLCADQGVGVIPWSPLARGRLTRDWDEVTERSQTDEFGKPLYTGRVRPHRSSSGWRRWPRRAACRGAGGAGVDARQAGRHRADRRRHQAAPPRRRGGRRRRASSRDEEIAALEEPYVPHPVAGFA